MFHVSCFKFNCVNGFAVLPIVLLIGGLIAEISIVGVFMAYYLNQSTFGVKSSEQALAAAQSGIQDALIRIIRNPAFNPSPNPYTLNLGSYSAEITVCRDACSSITQYGQFQIDSLGISSNKQRKIEAIISVNWPNYQIILESEKEIAIE